jgi:hypothetical protein
MLNPIPFWTASSARHKTFFFSAVILLLAGTFNYYFFQPNIVLFESLGFHTAKITLTHHPLIQHFLTGYFSDALWCSALLLITVILSEVNYLLFRYKILILLLPFITEAAQGFGLINGSFDWFDLLTYGIIESVFVFVFPILITPRYEKR